MGEENVKQLEELAKPLMKLLSELGHPHFTAIVTLDSVEILESKMRGMTEEFIRD